MKAIVWILAVLGVLAILVLLFYEEEDSRGKHAWDVCKSGIEAKGQSLNWNDYIPPAVPDGQNFFEAPRMQEWFVSDPHSQTNELAARFRDKKFTGIMASVAAGTNLIGSMDTAKDFLAWSDQFEPDFDLIQNALVRPYARMYGDYSHPPEIPIPNFVNVRLVAEVLAQRTHSYLLMNQPDRALHELTLLYEFRRILEGAPTGKPMTLVAAMINVAITGLYANAVADGIRLHTWQEPQLVSIRGQLDKINLPPIVTDAFRSESAYSCRILENLFFGSLGSDSSLFPHDEYMPRGWIYQNMILIVTLESKQLDAIDLKNETFMPGEVDDDGRELENMRNHPSPYTFLACIAVPNTAKAWRTTAYYQTMVNEAQIACALERYRLAHGEYPETLDALVPQYIQIIPHDLIGGQPLHYRRTNDGKFLLYSIGRNETDDGGQPSPNDENGRMDYTKGDWVWPVTTK